MPPSSLAAGVAGTTELSQMVAGEPAGRGTVVNCPRTGAGMALPLVSDADTDAVYTVACGQRRRRA